MRGLLGHLGRQLAQRAVVVKDVKAAAETGDYQIVLASLNLQVACSDGGNALFDGHPTFAFIIGKEYPKLSAHKQQFGLDVVLNDAVSGAAFGQIPGDARPCSAFVTAHVDVGFEIALFVVVEGGIHRVFIVDGCANHVYVRARGDTRKALNFRP